MVLTIKDINKRLSNSRFTALKFAKTKVSELENRQRTCLCRCTCGKKRIVSVSNLVSLHVRSCGCLRKDSPSHPRKYSVTNVHIYNVWGGMIRRCYNKTDRSYPRYGFRGVRVCREWRNNYQTFLDWSLANGWHKGLQLDKDIKGNGKLYSPTSCTWVTTSINQNYKRTCVMSQSNGVKMSLKMRCVEKGFNKKEYNMVRARVLAGLDIEVALNTPKGGLK